MGLELSEDSKRAIEEIFMAKDKNGNGIIDRDELDDCLALLGVATTSEELTFLKNQFDANGDGTLEVKELMQNLEVINMHSVKGEEMMQAFKKFDVSGDGFLSQSEIRAILTCGPEGMTSHEANMVIMKILKDYDLDRDGRISYAEFVRICMGDNLLNVL